jgi:hypothetical protein
VKEGFQGKIIINNDDGEPERMSRWSLRKAGGTVEPLNTTEDMEKVLTPIGRHRQDNNSIIKR